MDKLPPHSEAAEKGLLGCIFLDQATLLLARQRFKAGEEYFYDLVNQTIYDACCRVDDAGRNVDLITVADHLRAADQLKAVGGMAYLSSTMDDIGNGSGASHYIDVVMETHAKRKLIRRCMAAADAAMEYSGDVAVLAGEVARDLSSIQASVAIQNAITPVKQAVIEASEQFDKEWQAGGEITGIKTGWAKIDRTLWGLQPGQMNVIGARPGFGKTAVLCNIFRHACVENGVPSMIFSYEMTAKRLVARMACDLAGIDLWAVREKRLSEGQFQALSLSLLRVGNAPLYIVDTMASSDTIQATVRQAKEQYGIQLVGIDYLQKVPRATKSESQTDKVTQASIDIYEAIRKNDVASVVLAQINREGAKHKNGRPTLEDLKQSGQIEQDADNVFLLHRPEQELDNSVWDYEFLLAKARDGGAGEMFPMRFKKRTTTFVEAED